VLVPFARYEDAVEEGEGNGDRDGSAMDEGEEIEPKSE
jgi:hypothetical protein